MAALLECMQSDTGATLTCNIAASLVGSQFKDSAAKAALFSRWSAPAIVRLGKPRIVYFHAQWLHRGDQPSVDTRGGFPTWMAVRLGQSATAGDGGVETCRGGLPRVSLGCVYMPHVHRGQRRSRCSTADARAHHARRFRQPNSHLAGVRRDSRTPKQMGAWLRAASMEWPRERGH